MLRSIRVLGILSCVVFLPFLLHSQAKGWKEFSAALDSLEAHALKDKDTVEITHWKKELSSIIAASPDRNAMVYILIDTLNQKVRFTNVWTYSSLNTFAELALEEVLKCEEWADKSCMFDAYYFRGMYLQKTGKTKDCIHFFKAAIDTDKALAGGHWSTETGDCRQYMGHAYTKLADDAEAIRQYELSRSEYLGSIGENTRPYLQSLLILSMIYSNEKQYDEALMMARRVIEGRKQLPGVKPGSLCMAYLNLVSIFINNKQMDSCQVYLAVAREILLRDETRNVNGWKIYFDYLSTSFTESGQTDMALTAIDSALAIEEKQGGEYTREAGKFLSTKSEIFLNIGKYDAALETAHEALRRILPDIKALPSSQNPSKEDLSEEPWQQTALAHKAEAWEKMSLTQTGTAKVQYLEKAVEALARACDVVDNMRSSFVSGESRLDLSDLTYSQYESGIRCSMQLYDLTHDSRHLSTAWDFMERSKAMALLTQLTGLMASELILPDSMKAREKLLGDSITWYSSRQVTAKGTAYTSYHSALLRKEEEQKEFIRDLELTYPSYYQFKYDLKLAPMDSLQAYLKRKEGQLLEYFVGDSAVFVMSVSPSDIRLIQLPRHGPWEDALTYYCNGISGISDFENANKPLQQSRLLYAGLVKPLISSSAKRLFVVPDGELWSLPYEALVTGPATSFSDAPFLLHQFPIQYAWSGNFLLKMPHLRLKGNQQLLAYAPSFGEDENEDLSRRFGKLTHNTIEAKTIAGITGGQLCLAGKATEKSFREQAPRYSVLHVASHAMMRKGRPDSTGIVFQQMTGTLPPEEDGFLSITEMGNMRLNAEMAVLSACETGDGNLVRGEGLMSLARSFTNTGCRSLVMSLWKVDDEATSIIMTHFYQNLRKGMEKDVALQQAKISYLTEGNRHPADWAAFVSIGSPDQVTIRSSPGLVIWLVLAGIALIIILGAGAFTTSRQ